MSTTAAECTAAPARNVGGRKRLSRRAPAPLHPRKSRNAIVFIATPQETTTQVAATPAHGKAVINIIYVVIMHG